VKRRKSDPAGRPDMGELRNADGSKMVANKYSCPVKCQYHDVAPASKEVACDRAIAKIFEFGRKNDYFAADVVNI